MSKRLVGKIAHRSLLCGTKYWHNSSSRSSGSSGIYNTLVLIAYYVELQSSLLFQV